METGSRCAFSARNRSEAMWPALREPSVKPERKESVVVRRRRRSKGMSSRGEVESGFAGGVVLVDVAIVGGWDAAILEGCVCVPVEGVLSWEFAIR